MDFDLSDEQRLLQESVERLVADQYGFEQRKVMAREADGWSRAMWARFAKQGLLGLPFAEADGGFGGGPVEVMIVMEALGKAIPLEPYFATVIQCGSILRHGASAAQRQALVPGIAAGELILAFAHAEKQSRYELADVTVTAKRDGDGWVLDGDKSLVLHGDTAHKLIVSARVSGSRLDRDDIGLFLVDAKAAGVTRRGYPTMDGARGAEISLANVRVASGDAIGEPGKAIAIIERMAEDCIAALASEAVGNMQALLDTTVEYLKTRVQFGQPIGKFQALQHRAADMLVSLELGRSMQMYATMMVEGADAVERSKAMSAAKIQIGKSARFVGQQAIQLHGGIGATEELKVGHYFRRITMMESQFGDVDHHIAKLSDAGGLIAT
jgi:pimeloyl-CoA dehydrogenase small subunit